VIHKFTLENGTVFSLRPLLREEIDEAQLLCDACVGKNLYSKQEIAAAIDAEDRFFYLLKNEKEETVGYIYYYLTDEAYIAKYAKLEVELFRSVYKQGEKRIGKIQSVGLKNEYRGNGLAAYMIQFILKDLRSISTEAVFIVCWKPGGFVPLKRTLINCDFKFLVEAKKVWYDDTKLICPYCHGRCVCDAEVYYKLLNEEKNNEA